MGSSASAVLSPDWWRLLPRCAVSLSRPDRCFKFGASCTAACAGDVGNAIAGALAVI